MNIPTQSTIKQKILCNIAYTELVYHRINKKLRSNFSKEEIEALILKIIKETNEKNFQKIGKNIYISNLKENITITINFNTYTVITVNQVRK